MLSLHSMVISNDDLVPSHTLFPELVHGFRVSAGLVFLRSVLFAKPLLHMDLYKPVYLFQNCIPVCLHEILPDQDIALLQVPLPPTYQMLVQVLLFLSDKSINDMFSLPVLILQNLYNQGTMLPPVAVVFLPLSSF